MDISEELPVSRSVSLGSSSFLRQIRNLSTEYKAAYARRPFIGFVIKAKKIPNLVACLEHNKYATQST
jgi:hypothetical protein